MVGVTGFEPATSASRTLRATKLRYTPMMSYGLQTRGILAEIIPVMKLLAPLTYREPPGRPYGPPDSG
jgi:hypothetical protein